MQEISVGVQMLRKYAWIIEEAFISEAIKLLAALDGKPPETMDDEHEKTLRHAVKCMYDTKMARGLATGMYEV